MGSFCFSSRSRNWWSGRYEGREVRPSYWTSRSAITDIAQTTATEENPPLCKFAMLSNSPLLKNRPRPYYVQFFVSLLEKRDRQSLYWRLYLITCCRLALATLIPPVAKSASVAAFKGWENVTSWRAEERGWGWKLAIHQIGPHFTFQMAWWSLESQSAFQSNRGWWSSKL